MDYFYCALYHLHWKGGWAYLHFFLSPIQNCLLCIWCLNVFIRPIWPPEPNEWGKTWPVAFGSKNSQTLSFPLSVPTHDRESIYNRNITGHTRQYLKKQHQMTQTAVSHKGPRSCKPLLQQAAHRHKLLSRGQSGLWKPAGATKTWSTATLPWASLLQRWESGSHNWWQVKIIFLNLAIHNWSEEGKVFF